jgi:hypothetical protein
MSVLLFQAEEDYLSWKIIENPLSLLPIPRSVHFFQPQIIYSFLLAFEIFNGFFDPNTFKVKIPGIHYDLNKVLDGQPLCLFLRTFDSNHTLAIIELSLVDDSLKTTE